MEFPTPKLVWILLVLGLEFYEDVSGKPNLDWDSWLVPTKPKCEVLKIAACKDAMYNMTVVPNSLGHRTQEEAQRELSNFTPLMKVRCSPYFQQFLCLLYAPVCTIMEKPILPCRSLCKKAKKGCVELMRKFGFQWPEVLRCNKFPKKRGNSLCTGIGGGGGGGKKGRGKKRGQRKDKKKDGRKDLKRKGKKRGGKRNKKGKGKKSKGMKGLQSTEKPLEG